MKFHSIPESDRDFLALFPHRHDFIYARHVSPGTSPQWATENRHTLSDRAINKGEKLYGVRFDRLTQYFLLDIDRQSPYHPKCDRFATGRIFEAMEMLGVTDHLTVTSSYSEGIHIYFPLPDWVESHKLAAVLEQLLKYKGMLVEDGILEIFPNNRTYDSDGTTTLFKAHRLPLQLGSYLINDDWHLEWSSREEFVRRWQFCQQRNTINKPLFDRLLKESTRKFSKLSFKAEKFLNDLHTEIEPGWSGNGQTNYLLGRITLRAYVFGHYVNGGEPLKGERLVQEIVKVATSLPGYHDHCRHRHEIWERAEEWARCAENSKYFPYGRSKATPPPPKPTYESWNDFLKRQAIERLCFALADLINEGRLPATITERFDILTREYHFSGETLYRNQEIWHPRWFTGGIHPPHTPPIDKKGGEDCSSVGANPPPALQSLLPNTDRNPLSDKGLGWFEGWDMPSTGRNSPPDEGLSRFHPPLGGEGG